MQAICVIDSAGNLAATIEAAASMWISARSDDRKVTFSDQRQQREDGGRF
ncbi:MAG: hypothetical protein J0G37_05875 [Afipia sp.]|nr:hypothetical protein [Afipia sp.]